MKYTKSLPRKIAVLVIRILHTNDTHGKLTADAAARMMPLRDQCDLYFDTGDCIRTGNLGVPLGEEPVWKTLQALRCDAGVLGNRETHPIEMAFRMKIAGAAHKIVVANLRRQNGSAPFPASILLSAGGIDVGVFGVMVPMVTQSMASAVVSAYVWDPPIEVARKVVQVLRPRCKLLIALTHIGHGQDLKLAEVCPDIDVILGGHSHTVLSQPAFVGKTAICQGGSHHKHVGVYEWSQGILSGGLRQAP
jgi:2',3'-cyclic-nucleotide 2'-phosphodiesterase (5'-nucleotidase family)